LGFLTVVAGFFRATDVVPIGEGQKLQHHEGVACDADLAGEWGAGIY